MPLMTGLQLRQRVSQLRPDLPVLIATGYGEMPAEAGNDLSRLGKPFTQKALAEAVLSAVRAPPVAV
jgi:FixJ family two-component response regulator